MDVIWFAQSVDDAYLEVVRSGVAIEDRSHKIRLIEDAQKGVHVPHGQEYGIWFSPFHPFVIRGFLRPDCKSANGRIRTSIFKVAFAREDSTHDVVEAVGKSLDCLGVESSVAQKKRFLENLKRRIDCWRKKMKLIVGLCVVAVVVVILLFEKCCSSK